MRPFTARKNDRAAYTALTNQQMGRNMWEEVSTTVKNDLDGDNLGIGETPNTHFLKNRMH